MLPLQTSPKEYFACGLGTDEPYYRLLSPHDQVAQDVPLNEILCKENFVFIKKYNDSPACVTPETKQNLIERGWARG